MFNLIAYTERLQRRVGERPEEGKQTPCLVSFPFSKGRTYRDAPVEDLTSHCRAVYTVYKNKEATISKLRGGLAHVLDSGQPFFYGDPAGSRLENLRTSYSRNKRSTVSNSHEAPLPPLPPLDRSLRWITQTLRKTRARCEVSNFFTRMSLSLPFVHFFSFVLLVEYIRSLLVPYVCFVYFFLTGRNLSRLLYISVLRDSPTWG